MFDRIRKAFAQPSGASAEAAASQAAGGAAVAQWAAARGLSFSGEAPGQDFAVTGRVAGKPWKMELGRSSRNYIQGTELRARAELGLSEDMAAMVMSRPLREALEKKAYSIYTDGLQTTVDPNLSVEMRWLAMYEEMAWDELPREFTARFCVLADRQEIGQAWVDAPLAQLLGTAAAPAPDVPFVMMLLRGKAYLRMEFTPADIATLDQAAGVFTAACEAALRAFGPRRPA